MLRIAPTLAASLCLSAPAAAGDARDCARDVRSVQELERAWLDMYERHDPDAMTAILTPDFTITFENAAVETKQDVVDDVAKDRGKPGPKYRTEDVQGRCYGDTVVLVGWLVRPDGNRSRYTDIYIRRGGRWLVAASHLSSPGV